MERSTHTSGQHAGPVDNQHRSTTLSKLSGPRCQTPSTVIIMTRRRYEGIALAALAAAICTTLGLLGTALQTWALLCGEYSPLGALFLMSLLATGWLTVITAAVALVLGIIAFYRCSRGRWMAVYAIIVGALPLLGVLVTQLL